MTATLRGFFYAAAAIGLAAALAGVNEARRIESWLDGDVGSAARLADAREATAGLVALFGFCGLALAVLTIVWWYQAYSAIARTGASGRSWSPGWAVGGWFIPIGNLIIPRLVLDEVDRVSSAAERGAPETWRDSARLASARWWWGCFVAASVLVAVGTTLTTDQLERGLESSLAYRRGLWLTTTGLALDVASALFATTALRAIGSRICR